MLGQGHEDHGNLRFPRKAFGHGFVHGAEELLGLLVPHVVARFVAVVGRQVVLEGRVVEGTRPPVVDVGELLAVRAGHVRGQLHALERAEAAADERETVGAEAQQEVARAEPELLQKRAHEKCVAYDDDRLHVAIQVADEGSLVGDERRQRAVRRRAGQLVEALGETLEQPVCHCALAALEALGEALARSGGHLFKAPTVRRAGFEAVRRGVDRHEGRLRAFVQRCSDVFKSSDAVVHVRPPCSRGFAVVSRQHTSRLRVQG